MAHVYSLNLFTTNNGQERLYINGTTRSKIYFMAADDGQHATWSSKTADTPRKYQTGDHYGKLGKDTEAVHEVAAAYGVKIGSKGDADAWPRLRSFAVDGIQVPPRAAEDDE